MGDAQFVLRYGARRADVRHLPGRSHRQSRPAAVPARRLPDVPVPGQHSRDYLHLRVGADRLVCKSDARRRRRVRRRELVAGRVHPEAVQLAQAIQLAQTGARFTFKKRGHQLLLATRRPG